jgi:light-regulated signal transduction histidine kinase (bacteriophytochrome)
MEKDLARSNTELQSFAYAASHDLREPLRTISGFLELLEIDYGAKLDDKAKDYINRAVSASMRLHEMIDDLLSFSRLETRKKAFAKVDLNGIYRGALHDLGRTIKEHNASISADTLPSAWVDDTQIATVFRNLIDNAIKFHRKESPVVHISAKKEGDEWLISVRTMASGSTQ